LVAGGNLTTGNNNIDIGNFGVAGDSNTIRIGRKGVQARAVIAGINNSSVFGSPVVVNINGRLGIQASSARFKRDIRDMGDASAGLLRLRPVSFRYKQDPNRTLQYGLIAEEVERVLRPPLPLPGKWAIAAGFLLRCNLSIRLLQ
jgi:hypothetical protein